jgi:hypothetical protein
MNRDEAIRVLNLHRAWFAESCITQALDYAIAYMEPKPTQFDERVKSVLSASAAQWNENNQLVALNGFAPPENVYSLLSEMLTHIQKLEKGQSDGL